MTTPNELPAPDVQPPHNDETIRKKMVRRTKASRQWRTSSHDRRGDPPGLAASPGSSLASLVHRFARKDASTIMTVDEAADVLRVNRKTVYDLVNSGELPGARKIGRVIRLCRRSLLQWLAQGQGRAPHTKARKP